MSDPRTRNKAQSDFERNGVKVLPTALESRFAEARSQLGPHRQQLIRAILENCEETCFLSSRELAKRYSVDAATVVRTVQALGYKGFADFSVDLRQHFMTRITPYTALKAATREPGHRIGQTHPTFQARSDCRHGLCRLVGLLLRLRPDRAGIGR
jgi:DNA-binding MarR family transcriptional regulator